MKKIIQFNDKQLEVDSLKTTIKPIVTINNNLLNKTNSIVKKIGNYESSPKIIVLSFPLQHQNKNNTIEKIGSFFYTEDVKRLVNPRDESKFFLAKLEGEIEYNEDGNIVYCTVSMVVPEGVSRSIDITAAPF